MTPPTPPQAGSAGRELDARIAETVFGALPAGKGFHRADPHYSTDIAAAWRVVREMERRGATVVYRTYGPRLTRNRIEITASVNGFTDSLFAASADDAPLAICLAALAALGGPSGDTE